MEGVKGFLFLWLPLLLPFWTCITIAVVDDSIPRFREAPVFRNGRSCPSNSLPSVTIQNDAFCDATSIHVAMTLERGYLRGTMAAVLSIVQHAECPENVVFHFLASDQDVSRLQERLRTAFPYLRFKVYTFDTARVEERISPSIRQALDHPLNYARAYIPEILPACLRRIIYLDSDILVFDDLAKLWGTELNDHALAAPEYCHANFSMYFSRGFWSEESLSKVFEGRRPCYFNTGVMVMDLDKWRTEGYARVMEMWMEIQKQRRIYELGSLPPFLLVFAGQVEPVAHRWNQHGLGGDNRQGRCRALHPGPVSLLHWSGKGKPWQRLDDRQPCPLDTLWASYDLLVTAE